MKPDSKYDFLVRPTTIPAGHPGVLLSVTPEEAGWGTLGFTVRRLAEGASYHGTTGDSEAAIVVLGGKMNVDWGEGAQHIGERENVFSGYPYCVYLSPNTSFDVKAESVVEFSESRVHSRKQLNPRIIAPADVGEEVRGGGDTTRQILRVIRPEDEADRLMVNEVYTPGGNWSSYPPHKHECQNLPAECDLDEIYYFRVDHPDGFAFLRVYDSAGTRDDTVTIRDGDLALLRGGYHMVAAAPGYRVYYQAALAGAARALAASTDPRYSHLSKAWPAPDPRVPFISRSKGRSCLQSGIARSSAVARARSAVRASWLPNQWFAPRISCASVGL